MKAINLPDFAPTDENMLQLWHFPILLRKQKKVNSKQKQSTKAWNLCIKAKASICNQTQDIVVTIEKGWWLTKGENLQC